MLRHLGRRRHLRLLAGRRARHPRDGARALRPAARAAAAGQASGCGCGPISTTDATGSQVFGSVLYADQQAEGAVASAVEASLGCGVPTAVADLHEGETVLDLGSGAGADVLISAKRVGATGKAIGLDMTDEMLELARSNAAQAGVTNVEFVKGYIEAIPLPAASIDVIVSNCVLNLSADKARVFAEAARVLRPGGRFAVSDVIADPDMDDATRADMAAYTGCIAGRSPSTSSASASPPRASRTSRSARRTACTSTPAPRSSALAFPRSPCMTRRSRQRGASCTTTSALVARRVRTSRTRRTSRRT